jgi:hypothetical protein
MEMKGAKSIGGKRRYHRYWASAGLLRGNLEVKQRAVLLGVLKVELVEAAHAGQQHAVVELAHVAAGL